MRIRGTSDAWASPDRPMLRDRDGAIQAPCGVTQFEAECLPGRLPTILACSG
jgi:hypothetical protein